MEKIYNFAKKIFLFLHLPMLQLFFGSFMFFPVCRAFERSEQNQAIAEIRDYASSMLGELDLQEQAIFNATRNLYSDRDFTSIYYNSTRSSSSSLFYDMTLLQNELNCTIKILSMFRMYWYTFPNSIMYLHKIIFLTAEILFIPI